MAFYNNPKQLQNSWSIMCADPAQAAGAAVCCNEPGTIDTPGLPVCEYNRERTTWHGARARCEATPEVEVISIDTRWERYQDQSHGVWTGYAPVPADDAQYYIAKDRSGAGGESICHPSAEVHDVRCCSDTSLGGFARPVWESFTLLRQPTARLHCLTDCTEPHVSFLPYQIKCLTIVLNRLLCPRTTGYRRACGVL